MSAVPPPRRVTPDDFRLLVESVEDYAIFMLDTEGRVATWNRGAAKIHGYAAHEIIGRHFSAFYAPEDVAAGKPEEELRIVREHGRVEDEGWRVRKDGTRFRALIVITALYDADGNLRGFGKVTRDLTARRAAEEELRRSEERFRLLVEGVRDYAIYMLDPEGRVTTWNTGAATIKGYAAAEILGKHFSAFFTPEDIREGHPDRELQQAATTGRFEEEGWRVRRDGSRFWAGVVVAALRDGHGELFGFAKVTRDLTVRRASEETARRLVSEQATRAVSEEESDGTVRGERERYRALSHKLEAILEGVADGITVQDCSGALRFANSAAARMSGFASAPEMLAAGPDEILRRFELLDENDNPFDTSQLPGRRVLTGASSASALLQVRERTTGQPSWSSVRATAVPGEDGRAELAVNIWHDVTEERRREQHERLLARATVALTSSLDYEELVRRVVTMALPALGDLAVLELRSQGDVRRFSAAYQSPELQRSAEALCSRLGGQTLAELWSLPTDKAALRARMDDSSLGVGGDPVRAGTLRDLRVGSLVSVPLSSRGESLGMLLVAFRSPGGVHAEADVRLLEELARRALDALTQARLFREAEIAARRAEDAARRAEEAGRVKDEFLATVSHELRTPLNAILGWASLLRDRRDHPSLAKGLDVIHRNAVAQGKLIDDILDVSRIITGKLRLELKPADLVAIVRDAIEVVRPSAAAKGLSIHFTPPAEPCLLIADPERLQQVMWNLLSNAVKFTDTRGTITIELRQMQSRLLVSVADTGRGIAPEFLPYVFERFHQADSSTTRRVGGLGLGLAIVRHILELHGGRVEVQSAGPGAGTTFTVELPVRAIAPTLEPEEVPESLASWRAHGGSSTSLLGRRVLVVDDERDARELLQAVLTDAGASVETAASAGEGFDRLRTFRPDVVVCDIGMPNEDGYAFMGRVRGLPASDGGAVPAIALTAYARGEDRSKALQVGFSAHIGKPVNPNHLVATIRGLAPGADGPT